MNKKLWAIIVATATALSYTVSMANGRYILVGNGEQLQFEGIIELSQYLHRKKYQGTSAHYVERTKKKQELAHEYTRQRIRRFL